MAISRTRAREAGRPVRESNNGFGKISPELIIIISKYAVQEEAHCIAHILIVLLFAHGHQLTNKVTIKVGPKCVQNQLLLPVRVIVTEEMEIYNYECFAYIGADNRVFRCFHNSFGSLDFRNPLFQACSSFFYINLVRTF